MSLDFRLGFALVLLDLIITLLPAGHAGHRHAAALARELAQ